MKVSIILLPILAGLGLASILRERAAQAENRSGDLGAAAARNCCDQTPCIIGCYVEGFGVAVSSYCLNHTASSL